MNAAEIIVRKVQGDGGFQMGKFLAKSIGQPRKSPHRHSHSQVLPFHETGRNLIGIRLSDSDFGYNLRDPWWGVPRFGALAVPLKRFHELREVNVRPELLGNCHRVMVQPICRELHTVGKALMQVPQEGPRIRANALADAERRNHFFSASIAT